VRVLGSRRPFPRRQKALCFPPASI
jgi:hypothetical protein